MRREEVGGHLCAGAKRLSVHIDIGLRMVFLHYFLDKTEKKT